MSISKSRLPKGQRTGRELDAEILPDPSDYFATARYLDRRAELGDFSGRGTPAFALHVLHYLWRHTARNKDKLSQNETTGWVLAGKSKIGKIATESGISYNAAQRALDWLYQEGWVDVSHEGQSYRWRPALTVEDHEKRTAGETVTAQVTVPESEASIVTAEGTAVPAEGTVFSSAVTVFSAEVTHNRESTGIEEGDHYSVPAQPGCDEEINEKDRAKTETDLWLELSLDERRSRVLGYIQRWYRTKSIFIGDICSHFRLSRGDGSSDLRRILADLTATHSIVKTCDGYAVCPNAAR